MSLSLGVQLVLEGDQLPLLAGLPHLQSSPLLLQFRFYDLFVDCLLLEVGVTVEVLLVTAAPHVCRVWVGAVNKGDWVGMDDGLVFEAEFTELTDYLTN